MSNIQLHLEALIECIDKIEKYSKDFLSADEFYHDSKSFDASMMQFVVIGETISRMDDDFKNSQNQIPWQKIKDFRNIIAHDYFGIDPEEIWDIIQGKLIPLKKEILKILHVKKV
jgi:uncharacterized protein with HEPN domain